VQSNIGNKFLRVGSFGISRSGKNYTIDDFETISKLLEHDDTRTTYKYLGINMDDMNDAMKILRDFDKTRLS